MPLAYPIHEATLDNGLRVIVSPDHSVPVVTVNIWVGVGSRHEVVGRTGFAHLFEHLMFQGSRNVASGEHFSALMAQGARLNATTWFDRTNYFETLPVGALELALWLEADRHGHLLDAVNQANLDNQRDVVKEEKRQRYDNVPYGNALPDVYASVFPQGHPYHHPTIGSMADLDAASLDDVHAFFKRYYGPDNTVITLVGDITPERGIELVSTYFGALEPIGVPPRGAGPQLPPAPSGIRVDRVSEVPNPRFYIAYRLPADGTDDYFAASMAVEGLAGLVSSPVHTRFVRREQTVTSAEAVSLGLIDGASLALVTLDIADGADPEEVLTAYLAESDAYAAAGPSDTAMQAILAQAERAWLSALADQEERADLISQHALLHGDSNYINTALDRLRAVTPTAVAHAAQEWLTADHAVVIAYLPANQSSEEAA